MTSLLRARTHADRTGTGRWTLARNVGREDRLVRGCIALSLLLLGGFALLTSGQLGVISMLFVLLLGYFVGTATTGWDPVYARTGIDTRSDLELDGGPGWGDDARGWADDEWAAQDRWTEAGPWGAPEPWAGDSEQPSVLDLTDRARATTSPAGTSPRDVEPVGHDETASDVNRP